MKKIKPELKIKVSARKVVISARQKKKGPKREE